MMQRRNSGYWEKEIRPSSVTSALERFLWGKTLRGTEQQWGGSRMWNWACGCSGLSIPMCLGEEEAPPAPIPAGSAPVAHGFLQISSICTILGRKRQVRANQVAAAMLLQAS